MMSSMRALYCCRTCPASGGAVLCIRLPIRLSGVHARIRDMKPCLVSSSSPKAVAATSHHQVHPDAPAVENDGFLCPDPFDWFAVPRAAQSGDGAQLGLLGHAVAADELPTLRSNDAVQRLAKVETLDQTFKRKVARHKEGNERLFRFRPKRLEFLPVGLRAGCPEVFVLLVDGLLSRLPQLLKYVVVFELHLVTLAELLFVLLLRRKGLIVGGGLTLSRLGNAPEPAARWLRLSCW